MVEGRRMVDVAVLGRMLAAREAARQVAAPDPPLNRHGRLVALRGRSIHVRFGHQSHCGFGRQFTDLPGIDDSVATDITRRCPGSHHRVALGDHVDHYRWRLRRRGSQSG